MVENDETAFLKRKEGKKRPMNGYNPHFQLLWANVCRMEGWIERSGVASRVIVLMSGTVGRRRERKGYEPS